MGLEKPNLWDSCLAASRNIRTDNLPLVAGHRGPVGPASRSRAIPWAQGDGWAEPSVAPRVGAVGGCSQGAGPVRAA